MALSGEFQREDAITAGVLFMLKCLVAAAAVLASISAAAHARNPEDRVQTRIPVTASDFSSPQREARLVQRVDRMIRNACRIPWSGVRGIAAAQLEETCRHTMHDDAEPKLLALRHRGIGFAAR
ncbi:UrcA family protein [Sphingomonas sp. 8AM]|uniref:UrcA family protein n=1 Tax=Sphingomonas sp. 8AM TaxID=2653170 RepID=UPI0013587CB2|nr:UrcA family protein [Sphingomonas sp. 8AM]